VSGRIFVVRHAKAGNRERFQGDDTVRPLSPAGRRQAEGLVGCLRDEKVRRIVSSAYLRCTQTVEPLAKALGLAIEIDDRVAEGAALGATHELIRDVTGVPTALCTHGDVIANLVVSLAETGTPGADRFAWKKGSIWVLSVADDGTVESAAYVPPPL
jgi:8-oxo-dGTP diphosphatase